MCAMVSLLCAIVIPDHFAYNKEKVRVLGTPVVYIESQPSFRDKNPEEGLKEALAYYGIKCPNIVYAQAILETGNFKSRICIEYNNIFGLYDTSNHRYYRFTSWQECVLFYKIKIQSRYKGGDYLTFLERINYAEATDYTKRLKELIMG